VTAFPAFRLPTADGSELTDADLAGRPHVVYVARHLG
jgi:peroxiredoxin